MSDDHDPPDPSDDQTSPDTVDSRGTPHPSELLEVLFTLLKQATEYLRISSEVSKGDLARQAEFDEHWCDDEDLWNLGSFCFMDEDDFASGLSGVEIIDSDCDSFDDEFQEDWS